MRSWVLAAALLLALPASASAEYRVLGEVPGHEEPLAVQGGEVFALERERPIDAFSAFGLNGEIRDLLPLGREGGLFAVDASAQAVAAITSRGGWFGPPAGPLALVPDDLAGVAVSGSNVLVLEGTPHREAIVVRDIATGAVPKLVARPGESPTELKAAGPYVSVVINHEAANSAIVVYEIASGREVYRLETGPVNGYDLGPDGRIVYAAGSRGRIPIQTATPAEPRLRTIARLRAMSYVALAGDEIALARPGAVSRMILLGLDGTQQTVSGPIGRVTSIAYDGATLAFIAGHCLYGGTGPSGPSTSDGCFDRAPVAQRWRVRGRRVVARVICRVPSGAHCRGVMRLYFGETKVLARRRLDLTPGEYVVRMRLKRRDVAKARSRPDAYLDIALPSPSTSS
jgi:hypothetical protein